LPKITRSNRQFLISQNFTTIGFWEIIISNKLFITLVGVHQKVWGKIFFIYVVEKLAGSTGILKTIFILNWV